MFQIDQKLGTSLNEEDEACLHAMLFSSSHVFPMVLNAATQLGLFDIIARAGPDARLSASEIASELETTYPEAASKLDRMLRLLASHSLLGFTLKTLEDGKIERLYGLTPAANFFLKREGEESLASLLALSLHPSAQRVWLNFKDAVVEGGNQFKKVHGMSIFEYMDIDPAFNTIFNKAMVGRSTIIMKKIIEIYEGFEGIGSLVDVGGGTGKCLNMVVSKYPTIKGINFDLPHVTNGAPSYPGNIYILIQVLSSEHVGGSMFSRVPSADAVMIKDILHNWSDENCIKILKNCYEAIPINGKVIVIDLLMPETPESSVASMYVSRLDNIMLMQPGGQERTEREFKALAEAAGFSGFKVVCCACTLWTVMELYK